jgi:hypothetical protein
MNNADSAGFKIFRLLGAHFIAVNSSVLYFAASCPSIVPLSFHQTPIGALLHAARFLMQTGLVKRSNISAFQVTNAYKTNRPAKLALNG